MITTGRNEKTRPLFWTLTAVAVWMVLPVFAGEGGGKGASPVIKPIPEVSHESGYDFRQEAEKYYDFIGPVDAVYNDAIVVGDTYYKVAPNARVSGAIVGTTVGIVLSDDGEIVVCEPFKPPKTR